MSVHDNTVGNRQIATTLRKIELSPTGELMHDDKKLVIRPNSRGVRIGYTFITWPAYHKLRKEVDGE